MPAKALHLIAGAAWLGGLFWLLVLDRRDAPAFMREAQRVSGVALGGVLLATLSGLAQTLLFLPSPLDLVRSTYGLVVLAKVAGVAVLVAFGAHHRHRVLPRLEEDAETPARFRATLRQEIVVMSLVVLLGGLLAYVPPPARNDVWAGTSHTSLQ
jgi:putative copper export protein